MSSNGEYDVVVAGGGMVGLLLASLLGRYCSALSVAVIEPQAPAPREEADALDVRVSALSPTSLELLDQVGVLSQLPPAARHPYESMCVWQDSHSTGSHSIRFTAAELGLPSLGSIVENHAVRWALWQQLTATPSIDLICQPVAAVQMTAAGCDLQLGDVLGDISGGNKIRTRLLVGADGARSRVREYLGVRSRERAYRQNALVAHLISERPHANTAWQKFTSQGPIALLPLADDLCSLVWSHPEGHSKALLAMSDEQFAGHLQAQTDGVLGALRCTTPRHTFPLARGHVATYTGERFALVGDAAHRVHPLAGQGANLGFLDVAVLVRELADHTGSDGHTDGRRRWADPGDARVLRRFERRRKGDNALTLGAMDGLNMLFSSPLAGLAGRGLGLVDRVGPLKKWLAVQAMGRRVNLPD